MCGVTGFFNGEANVQVLKGMISQLEHRGPDGFGYYLNHKDRVGLAHARLSILDIEGGFQPIHNEDRTVWVTFNGEIFNHKELRAELERFGHRFYTNTDTEVLVHLYEQFGINFVDRLNGQFAFALWDENIKTGLLVRDRVGIQPLFYAKDGQSLFFGSEMKAILFNSWLNKGLDEEQVANVLTFWSTSKGATAFKGIKEVLPGHLMIFRDGKLTNNEYWDHSYSYDSQYIGTQEEVGEQLKESLTDSVKLRMQADVPVGAYLSGGIDSTVNVALMREGFSGDLRTFSIAFQDSMFDESAHQQEAIQQLGVNHSTLHVTESDIADSFGEAIYHTEKPILRTAPIPMMLLSRFAKEQGYKVVMTGEGADEVFAGYDIFRENLVRHYLLSNGSDPKKMLLDLYPWMGDRISKSADQLIKFFSSFSDTSASYFSHEPRWRTTGKSSRFFSDRMQAQSFEKFAAPFVIPGPRSSTLKQAQYLEFHTLFSNYLISSQGDRMLMANGVEGRFPFLDPKVVDFGNSIHDEYKLTYANGVMTEKAIVKNMARGLIPDSIVDRKKQPYMAPDGRSFFNESKVHPLAHSLLSPELLSEYGYFDPKKAAMLKKKFAKGLAVSFADNMALIGMLSTQSLHSTFIENDFRRSTACNDRFVVQVEK